MNAFDSRWREMTHRARGARPELPDEPPLGFACRIRARAADASTASVEDLWVRFSLRSLIAVGSAFLILGALEYRSAPPSPLLYPGVENTVAQLLGTL